MFNTFTDVFSRFPFAYNKLFITHLTLKELNRKPIMVRYIVYVMISLDLVPAPPMSRKFMIGITSVAL